MPWDWRPHESRITFFPTTPATASGNLLRQPPEPFGHAIHRRALVVQGGGVGEAQAFGAPSGLRLSYAASMKDLRTAMDRVSEGLGRLAKEVA
jgi:hypothetical protein